MNKNYRGFFESKTLFFFTHIVILKLGFKEYLQLSKDLWFWFHSYITNVVPSRIKSAVCTHSEPVLLVNDVWCNQVLTANIEWVKDVTRKDLSVMENIQYTSREYKHHLWCSEFWLNRTNQLWAGQYIPGILNIQSISTVFLILYTNIDTQTPALAWSIMM